MIEEWEIWGRTGNNFRVFVASKKRYSRWNAITEARKSLSSCEELRIMPDDWDGRTLKQMWKLGDKV